MVLSRNSQIAIAVAGVIALGLIIYLFGIPREAGLETQREVPVAATDTPARDAPAEPSTKADDKASGETAKDEGAAEGETAGGTQQQAGAVPAAPRAPVDTPATPQPVVPSFDIVRVEPNGEAVIAGRAAPNGKVELLRNGEPFAEASTDAAGQFAMTPPALPAGTFELTLRLTDAEGRTRTSGQSVTVVVADDRKQQPMVALATPNAPTQVLSRPGTALAQGMPGAQQSGQQGPQTGGQDASPAQPAEGGAAQAQPPAGATPAAPATGAPAAADAPAAGQPAERVGVAIDAVDVESGGRLFVSGRGAPGATVRLYLNESYLAAGNVPADGRLSFSVERGVAPGDYRVRLDDVDPGTGAVLSRAEVPFTMPGPEAAAGAPAAQGTVSPAGPVSPEVSGVPAGQGGAAPAEGARPSGGEGVVVVPEVRTATVSRGDSLWRISRRIYGHGIRYTVIYDANQEQIRNPDLIYPGQVFVLPSGGAQQ